MLAWRNVCRYARRSLITISAVALGVISLIFLWGFNDGVHNTMMRNLQEVIVGSIQIHARGFFRKPALQETLEEVPFLLELLDRMHVHKVAPRLRAFALAAGRETSEGLVVLGIDPQRERRVTRLQEKLDRGRYLEQTDRASCILGQTTARNLGVDVGDEIVLLTEDRYHVLAAEKFRVVGIIASGEMGIDRGLAIIPLRFMQAWLDMGRQISGLVLQLPPERLEPVTAALRQRLDQRFEVLRWYDMYPMMKQWVELENGFYYIFLSIVLVIVAAGIANTVLMSMLDRIHEFGVMMALGCGRLRLAGMVVLESMLLGLAGMVAGCLAGLALVAWFGRHGIDLSAQMDTVSRFYVDPVVHTDIDTDHLLITLGAVLLAAVLAAIWPAVRVARLQPVEAMRHV